MRARKEVKPEDLGLAPFRVRNFAPGVDIVQSHGLRILTGKRAALLRAGLATKACIEANGLVLVQTAQRNEEAELGCPVMFDFMGSNPEGGRIVVPRSQDQRIRLALSYPVKGKIIGKDLLKKLTAPAPVQS